MVRSFLPKFSSRSEKRLLALCKNNPNKDVDIERWNKNAVQYLVRSLKKNLDIIDELERSISQECSDTKCVLLAKVPDNRLLIAHRRGLPQVIYCRLWRWPDLQSHHQIKAIDKCESRIESIPTSSGVVGSANIKTICVNPYHYERKKPLPLEPVYVPCSRIPPDLSTSYEDSEPTGGTKAISGMMSQQPQQLHVLMNPITSSINNGGTSTNNNSSNDRASFIDRSNSGGAISNSNNSTPSNPTNINNQNQASPAVAGQQQQSVQGQENIQAEQLRQQQQQPAQQQQQPAHQDNDDTVDFFSGLRPEQIPDVYYPMPADGTQQSSLVMSQDVGDQSRQQQQQPMHVQQSQQAQMPYHQSQAPPQQSQQPMEAQQAPGAQYQRSIHYQQHQPMISLSQQQQQQPQNVRTGQLQQHIKTEIAHPYQFKQNTFARQHLSMHDPDPVGQQNYSPQTNYGPSSSYYQTQQQQQQHDQYQQASYSQQSSVLQPVQQMTSYGPPVYQTDYQLQQYQSQTGAQSQQQQLHSAQMQLDHPMGQCQSGPCHSVTIPPQQLIGSQVLLAEIKYMEQSNWCSIFYNEYNIRVGERYQPRSPVVYVDGYTHPACADRYCVGGLSNVQRNEFTEWVRRRIGRGIKLSSVDGEVFVECLSESSIFISAPIMYAEEEGAQAMDRVIKVPHGSSMKVFSVHLFSRFLSTSIDMGFEACYKMTNFATFRISFVKGWGKNYKRQKIPETPCWLEIQLNAPLSWLDRVLRTMKPPQGCGSTS